MMKDSDNQPLRHERPRRESPPWNGRKQKRVALAEDDDAMRELLAAALKKSGLDVIECPDGTKLFSVTAGSVLDQIRPGVDLIISDVRMPGYTGLDFLEKVLALHWSLPVIIITAFGDDETHDRARALGAMAVFDKPFEIDDLIRTALDVLTLLDRNPGR